MRSAVRIGVLIVCITLAPASGSASAFETDVFGYEDWQRAVSQLPVNPQEVVYPFHVTPEMVEWAQLKLAPHMTNSPDVRLQALQNAFFQPGEFEFEYEQAQTLTAVDAFASRNGNCMSFTSLFVALSRSVGIPTFLVSVKRQPDVEMDEGLVVVNRHVVAGFRAPSRVYTYDFYVASSKQVASHRVIDDLAASAIYHTNIGGLAIRQDDLSTAIRNLQIATVLAPEWAPAWVNMGVAYSRLGDQEAAFDALQRALAAEPGNSSALTNLSRLYREQGRIEEADNAMRAAAEGTRNPFTLITMADAEILRGNHDEARRYLRRARWWYAKEPYVFDALARLAEVEGDADKAQKYRKKAGELRNDQASDSD
ncbi:MAG: transglutaminase domain-containing protein [Acidobacteriota bacterium]|nr:transglutaminase domain-containing protein [Acidobacteriota bacterium]